MTASNPVTWRRFWRCRPIIRALVHAYREFLDPDLGLDIAAADAELARRLEAIIDAELPRREQSGGSRNAIPRVWLAAAAVLVVCAGFFFARDVTLLRDGRLPDGVGIQRGDPADSLGAVWTQGTDDWTLTWRSRGTVSGGAVVVFYDHRMIEISRGALADSVYAVSAAPEGAVYLQIFIVDVGDTVARSAIVTARPDRM